MTATWAEQLAIEAEAALEQGDIAHAAASFSTALRLFDADHDPTGQIVCYMGIGECCRKQADNAGAIFSFVQAAQIARASGDVAAHIAALSRLGLVCEETRQFEQAITYYESALDAAQQRGDTDNEGRIMVHLGYVHSELHHTDVAIAYLDGSLPFITPPDAERAGPSSLIAAHDALTALAALLMAKLRYSDAIAHYRQALVYAHRLDDAARAGTILCDLAEALLKVGNRTEAIAAYETCAILQERMHDIRLAQTQRRIRELKHP